VKVEKKPSLNFDDRALPISMLVLHYTGMESGDAALERMRDPNAKVSAHYMIEEDGGIFQLVDDEKRAWHAGVSFWNGESDINSSSIGVEIVNSGHEYGLPEFPDNQIEAVMSLSSELIEKHDILNTNVVGHSDIAPGRKQDPGEKFPWKKLAQNGIGYWPEGIGDDMRVLFDDGARDRGVSVIQRGLAYIGYSIEVNGELDQNTRVVLVALQRRYRPNKIDGLIDVQTLEIITKLADYRKNISGSAAV